jgi:hypothetical protein
VRTFAVRRTLSIAGSLPQTGRMMSAGLFLFAGDWQQLCARGVEWEDKGAKSTGAAVRRAINGNVVQVGGAASNRNLNQAGPSHRQAAASRHKAAQPHSRPSNRPGRTVRFG